jgi:vanillate O-demethylase ferredoxin subunit
MRSANDPLTVTVRRKRVEAEDICSCELVRSDGGSLPPFEAGAHIDVHLRGGLIRQYSLYGDPADNSAYRIAVLREPKSRGGSVAVHDAVRENDQLTISKPRNNFPLAEDAPLSLLMAGGIGITPLLAMARRMAGLGRPFELHYCCRTQSRAAFLDQIKQSNLSENVRIYFDDAAPALDVHGVFANRPAGTNVYVCGPAGFIGSILETAQAAGIPQQQLHREFFAGPGRDTAGQAFTIVLQRTGLTLEVPAGKTVVEVLLDHGVDIAISCEQGICGTCVTKVLDGIPDHRDEFLTTAEKSCNDQFTPCCSRALTEQLVLDL